MEQWSLSELRWYLREKDPCYHLEHWWKRKDSAAAEGRLDVDEENPLLYSKDARKRSKIRVEPWLWEVLRRHPGLCSLRANFLSNTERIAEIGFEEYSRRRSDLLDPWVNRGRDLVEALALWGHLAWALGESSDPHSCLNERQREKVGLGIAEYSLVARNFPGREMLSPSTTVRKSRLEFSAEGRTSHLRDGKLMARSPRDHTLGELMDAAEGRGCELLVLEVSKSASVSSILNDVKGLLEEDGEKWSRSPHSTIRLRPDRLELIALLDGDSEISPSQEGKLSKLFGQFVLTAADE